MHLQTKTVRQGINKAYLKVNVKRADLDAFKEEATAYLNNLEHADGESEEHLKGYLKDFLQNSFYTEEERLVNTSNRVDLGIYSGKTKSSTLEVLIEAKKPGNTREMITKDNPNGKALHEALLYYFEEREAGNEDLKQVVVTNYTEFFLFDAQEIERNFYSKKSLVKMFNQWKTDKKVSSNTEFMYSKFEEFIKDSDANLNAVHVDLSKFKKKLAAPASEEDDKKLIPLYKLFSPEHLVKKPFANDSNSLDKRFYNEFLHILGLQEVKEKGSRLIQRLPKEDRQSGSLIESTIDILKYGQHMSEVREATVQYGDQEDDQLFGVALELVITWMNRVLFLKLMESQLLAYHNHDPKFKFLSFDIIDEYDELNKLFFWVLALRNDERNEEIQKKFGHVPYLNSSLFDATKLEHSTIRISNLDDKASMDLYSRSVLKKGSNPPQGKLNTLDYLLRFLEAYNFSAESSGGIQTEDKALINASVLGLIFEKINGYKDGSFFTPGFITEYMARETLRNSVLDKCNEAFEWDCSEFDELKRKMESVDLEKANEVVNSITICDPAVGSGHFLVSCLNELIAIKSELKILCDHEGKRIPYLDIEVENDELAIEHEGELFEYKMNHEWKNGKVTRKPAGSDRQRVQVALFHEKKFLIENCLFGVDINPNSVKICRLRLWIELLKHAYYRSDEDYSELEVLPNIDINIKQGNSLVSRFGLDEDLSSIFKKSDHSLEDYKQAVRSYRETRDRSEKQRLQTLIDDIKAEYSENLLNNKPINKKLSKARGTLDLMQNEDLFGEGKATKKELKKQEKKVAKLEDQKAEEEAGAFYREAFEWRFEFPEVLDDEGQYIGFDMVIGNPPYMRIQSLEDFRTVYKDFYTSATTGNYDIYVLFIERGVEILKKQGELSYILPHKFIIADFGQSIRKKLFENRLVDKLIHFGHEMVFEDASTYTCLLFLNNDKKSAINFVEIEPEDLSLKTEYENVPYDKLVNNQQWRLKNGKVLSLLDKLDDQKQVFEDVLENIFSGIQTSADSIYVIDGKDIGDYILGSSKQEKEERKFEKSSVKPLIKGDDIKRYANLNTSSYVIFPYSLEAEEAAPYSEKELKTNFPETFSYLKSFEKELRARERGKMDIDGKWFLYNYPKNLYASNDKKLVSPDITYPLNVTKDEGNFCVKNGAYGIKIKEQFQKFENEILALLNSNILWFYLQNIGNTLRGGYFRFNTKYIMPLPIPDLDIVSETCVSDLVNQILTAKKENPEANTSNLEAEIDRLVYELYGLSEEEIGIVEGSAN